MFESLNRLATAERIELVMPGHVPLLESWSFFASQPVPTPPPWWRYSTKVDANQHCIDGLPPLGSGEDLFQHLAKRDRNTGDIITPNEIVPYPPMNTFLEERSYETFVVGLLLREKDAAEAEYVRIWNHEYDFQLIDPDEVMPGATSRRTFLITLQVTPAYLSLTEEHDPPDVGADVVIIDEQGAEEWKGHVIDVGLENVITMRVQRTNKAGFIMYNSRRGEFKFGQSSAAFLVAQRGVQRAIWLNNIDLQRPNWVKPILLARDSHNIGVPQPPQPRLPFLHFFAPMNHLQMQALAWSSHFGDRSADRLQMMQGPPGTGKTGVIAMMCIHAIQVRKRFMVVVETHYTVKVCADRLASSLRASANQRALVFAIERMSLSGLVSDVRRR